MALYTQPAPQKCTSGALSSEVVITNGARPGCPLSPLMFRINLGTPCTHDSHVPCCDWNTYTVGPTYNKMGLFADAVTLILLQDIQSLILTFWLSFVL